MTAPTHTHVTDTLTEAVDAIEEHLVDLADHQHDPDGALGDTLATLTVLVAEHRRLWSLRDRGIELAKRLDHRRRQEET